MNLEDYFDFLAPDDIRLKGTRVGIETILSDYLDQDFTAEQIAARYRTVSLLQVYATLTYYLQNQEKVEAYLEADRAFHAAQRAAQEANPPAGVLRLREIKKSLQKADA